MDTMTQDERKITASPQENDRSKENGEFISCKFLRSGIVFFNEQLASCCGSATVHQLKMKYSGEYIAPEEIIESRKRTENALNSGEACACSGCGLAKMATWPDEPYLCSFFNASHAYICNLRCTYCCNTFNNLFELFPDYYDIFPVLNNLYERELIDPKASITLAPGEPLLMPRINEVISLIIEKSTSMIDLRTRLPM